MARVNIPKNAKDEANYKFTDVVAYSSTSGTATLDYIKTALSNDIITKEGTYGAIMLFSTSRYIEFEVYENFKLWAVGTVYSDSGGASGKSINVYKYKSDGTKETYGTFNTYDNGSWYELFSGEAGKYRIETPLYYVSFNEFYFEKLDTHKVGLVKQDKFYSQVTLQKSDGSDLAKNIQKVFASGGTYSQTSMTNGTLGVNNGWSNSSTPNGWMVFEFKEPIALDRINICSFYNSGYEPIQDFNIEVSNTGTFSGEEKILFSGTHPYYTTATYEMYSFSNSRKYKFYRLNVKTIHYGNGGDNLAIANMTFHKDVSLYSLLELPQMNKANFEKYCEKEILADVLFDNRSYLLQDTVSENIDGLWVQELSKKPLSIKIE